MSSHVLRGGEHRLDDAGVAGTAAQVAFQPFAHLLLGRPGRLGEERAGGHQEAGRAVAALQAAVLGERLLERVKRTVARKPLDRRHRAALRLHREREARLDDTAVDEHRAGAAHASLAAALGAGQREIIAQQVAEQAPRRRLDFVGVAVDGERDDVAGHVFPMFLVVRWLTGRERFYCSG